MQFDAGRMLSHYRFVEKIGEGGMGVVWKALDTKLDREVALKILPDVFSDDPERLARFDREARLLASLNHRNIAAIYGVEESEGLRFLVMELIEGEDLARRLGRGALPVEEALDIAHQLARALEAAHEKGVLHRDLKPANIQVTHEGRVKVLDFGLAKAFESESGRANPEMSPTLTSAGTAAGVILGTAAYMSPEQSRGKILDKRADIWSFGCVLYESLTGRSPFRGETISDTIAAILKTEPEWSVLPESTPPRVRELLQRCLEKDPRNRLRDVGDARLELQRSLSGRESLTDSSGIAAAAAAVPERRGLPSVAALALVALLGAGAGIGLWNAFSGSGPAPLGGTTEPARVSIRLPPDRIVRDYRFVISPDGSALAFEGQPRETSSSEQSAAPLFTRQLDSFEARQVDGTVNGAQSWVFSPDGKWLAVRHPVAEGSSRSRISKVPVDGSTPPLALVDWDEDWTTANGVLLWLPDGDMLNVTAAPPQKIMRIPTAGGAVREAATIDFGDRNGVFALHPSLASLLPDGKHVLGAFTVWEESGYETSVAMLNLESGEGRVLIDNGSNPQLSPTGHLVFSRGDALLAVRFDADRLETVGSTVSVAAGMRAAATWADAYFCMAANGTLLFKPGGLIGGARQVVRLDRNYELLGPVFDDRRAFEGGLAASHDGSHFAAGIVNDEGLYDVWISEVSQPRLRQLVREAGRDCTPAIWTPDSQGLVYVCGSSQGSYMAVRPADGSGSPEILLEGGAAESFAPTSFLPGGSSLVLSHFSGTDSDVMTLPLFAHGDGKREPTRLIADAHSGKISPDGRWIAYVSDASGREEVYLRRLAAEGSIGPEIPVSIDGGTNLIWRTTAPGKYELLYLSQYDVLAVQLSGDRLSRPDVVTNVSKLFPRLRGISTFPDGGFLAVVMGDDEEEPTELSVVINWLAEL